MTALRLHWLHSHRQLTALGFTATAQGIEAAWPWMFGEPWPGHTVSEPKPPARD
jgi:hypothetical protein